MSHTAIEFQNVGKMYRLGRVGTGTLSHDLNRWWQMSVLRKEDPFLTIGQTNDRTRKGTSDYIWALRDITFKVEQGEVLGIIGKNGAGKSTLLKLLSNITSPSTGTIKYQGRIASLLEVGTGFHPEMTGRENIYMNGSIMGMTKQEITRKLDEIVEFAGVERYLDTPVKRYSSGMIVRLGFAVAAFLEPEILVVDEVLTVGDAEFQKKAIGKMDSVAKESGRTVLFVSHNMDSMLNLCKNGILLENGSLKYRSDIRSVVAEYLNDGSSTNYYAESNSKALAYLAEAKFVGTQDQKKGVFTFDESVTVELLFKRNPNAVIEKTTKVAVWIVTDRNVKVSIAELDLSDLVTGREKRFVLSYPKEQLMPGNYRFCIDIHVPNVCFYDRQEPLVFSILDNGSEFLKYNGINLGILSFRPRISE